MQVVNLHSFYNGQGVTSSTKNYITPKDLRFKISYFKNRLISPQEAKKKAQITNINVESTTANIKFFDSIYFLPFLRFGTGSNPLFPPKTFKMFSQTFLFGFFNFWIF